MQKDIQVSAVQFCPFLNDSMDKNMEFILTTMAEEAKKGADLVVFPETSITNFFTHGQGGYRHLMEEASISVDGDEIQQLIEAAKTHNQYVVVGFNEKSSVPGVIYNSCALIGPEGVAGVSRKQNFPGIEKLYYTTGPKLETFECALGKIGIIICYDVLFPEIARHHFRNAADVIVFSSSFWVGGSKGGTGDPLTKRQLWKALPLVTAVQNQAFVVSANGSGIMDFGVGTGVWERMGLSQIASPAEGVLAECDHSEEVILRATLKKDALSEARSNYHFFSELQPKGMFEPN
jgi:predicted amidohydrolase